MSDQAASPNEYLLLSRGQWDQDAKPEDIQVAIDEFYPWLEGHVAAGRMRMGSRLQREGATVSKKGVVLDGPYGETKELIGGYWTIIAESVEAAAALAAHSPCLKYGLFYEIRPLEPERASAFVRSNETPET